MEICLIEHDDISTQACKALIKFAKGCSWQGTGAYFAECLEEACFEDNEKIAAAFDGDKIVGFAALVNESCIVDDDAQIWLDFLFVSEEYRRKGIAKLLAEYLLDIARDDGINDVYLCTVSHERMYERFGFSTLYRTTINCGDECCIMRRLIS